MRKLCSRFVSFHAVIFCLLQLVKKHFSILLCHDAFLLQSAASGEDIIYLRDTEQLTVDTQL